MNWYDWRNAEITKAVTEEGVQIDELMEKWCLSEYTIKEIVRKCLSGRREIKCVMKISQQN